MTLCRAAAEAWEAAFIELAKTNLTEMAREAGLMLSFSAERSVADELARESYADVGTVRHTHLPYSAPQLWQYNHVQSYTSKPPISC